MEYLNTLELISRYDQYLANHIEEVDSKNNIISCFHP